jgi:hypothetical protein
MVASVVAMGSLIGVGLLVHAQTRSGSSSGGTGVNYEVTQVVIQMAMNPMPGPNAKQQTKQSTIGKDKAMVKTSKDNSFWVEEVDMDRSGNPVEAQMLWDDTDKVLYTYAEKPFQCKEGSPATGDFLIATYAEGNTARKPAGSGWWAASLNQGECKARTDELFGCKFDANGKNTACGVANMNDQTHELTIMEATPTSNQ